MANPSPAVIAAIRARVSDWTPGDQQIANALNVADQANPVRQPQVPKPLTISDLMGKLTPGKRGALYRATPIAQFVLDVRSGDRMAVAHWIQLAVDANDLNAADQTALMAEIDATIPDPAWHQLVSWAQLNLGRPADADDVKAARPGA